MTKDEYLHAALALFKSHFHTDDSTGSMTAARAGLLLKSHFPRALADAGFSKFGDLLRELESRGSIRTGLDSKNVLAIWFPESSPPGGPFRLLRDDIWRAFIARRPEGNRYLNRATGDIRLGLNSPPSLSEHWIQITPLSDETQKKWAFDFLASQNITDLAVLESLDAEPWYFHFGSAIGKLPAEVSRGWKRWRSERVVVYVSEWCLANGISPSSVFQDDQGFSRGKSDQQSATPSLQPDKTDAREIVLVAISMMPLDDLLNLPIPGKFLMAAMKASQNSK